MVKLELQGFCGTWVVWYVRGQLKVTEVFGPRRMVLPLPRMGMALSRLSFLGANQEF